MLKLFGKLCFMGIGIILVNLVFLLIILPMKKNTEEYQYSLLDKNKILQSTKGGRIIFVGGSNLAFGLDSKAIEIALHKKVINTGVNLGLGLKFMVQDVEAFLNPGDIVIIIPEYQLLYSRKKFNGEYALAESLIDVYPAGIKIMDAGQFFSVIFNIPAILKKDLLQKYFPPREMGVYMRKNFNTNGDMVGHLDLAPCKNIRIDSLGDNIDPYPGAIKFLNNFSDRLNLKRIKCYFLYPPFKENSFIFDQQFIHNLHRILKDKLSFPVLCSPEEFKFTDDLFFDTPYHLTRKGRDKRTQIIINILSSRI